MELADLRLFVRAAELGSFSKAAASLGIAQPTVTRIIGQLEAEWDGPLFYRTGRGVLLSEFGHEALTKARSLLRDCNMVAEDLRSFSRLPSGAVSIGVPTSLVTTAIPTLINRLRADLPGIRVQIYEGFNDQIERWLAEGTIEIGARSKYWEGGKAKTPPLLESRLVIAGPRKGWSLPPEIDFRQLADFALVLPARTNPLRQIVDSVARRMKVHLNIIADVDSTVGQKAIATQCGCYMVKAPHSIEDETAQNMFVSSIIRNPHITRHIDLVTGHQRPLSRASRQVAERLTAIMKEIAARPTGERQPAVFHPARSTGAERHAPAVLRCSRAG